MARRLGLDVDPVVDDLDESRRVALRDEGGAGVVGDREHTGGEPRAAVVERRVERAGGAVLPEVVLDVDV